MYDNFSHFFAAASFQPTQQKKYMSQRVIIFLFIYFVYGDDSAEIAASQL